MDSRFVQLDELRMHYLEGGQGSSGRSALRPSPSGEASWWVRKSGGEHHAEHLGRLREWTAELIGRRDDGSAADAPERRGG